MAADGSKISVKLSAEGIQEVLAAFRKVQKEAKETGKVTKGIGSNLGSELRSLGIAASVAQIARFIKANIEAQAAVQDLVETTGASAEAISVLGMAAKREGVEVDALGKGIKGLTKFMASVQEGGKEATATLKAMGLSAEDLKGKSLDQQLVTIANALDQFSSDGQSGMNKSALAMKVFGKAGLDMLQVMQQLSGDGFQQLQAEGLKTGQILSGDAARGAKEMKLRLAELEGTTTGLVNQFTQGLTPALADAVGGLKDAASSDSVDGFKKVGEAAGTVAKWIASAFIIAGHTVAYVFEEISTQLKALWEDITATAKALAGLFSGRYREAWEGAKSVGSVNRANQGVGRRWNSYGEGMQDALDSVWNRLPDTSTTSGKGKTKDLGLGGGSGDAGKAAKEAAAEVLAAIKRVRAMQKQLAAEATALNEQSYKAGLTSLEDYQAERRRILEAEGQAELDALAAQLQAEIDLGKEASKTKINDLKAEIQIRLRQNAQALQADEWTSEEERRKAKEEAGKHFQETLGSRMGTANSRLGNAQAATEQGRALGTIGDTEATRQQITAYEEWLTVAEQVQGTLALIAQESGDEAMAAEAEALRVQIDGVRGSLAEMGNEWQRVQDAGTAALASGMVDLLNSIGDGAGDVSESFRSMAQSIVKSIQQVLVKMMLMKAVQAMFGGSSAGSFGASMVKAFSFAEGGSVQGPGTSTSDSILARLSNGEYVMRAAAVQRYGLGMLDALNGLRVPTTNLHGYAEGGEVRPQGVNVNTTSTVNLTLDPGLILEAVDSPEGARIFAKHVGSSPKRFNAALGRR